MLHKILLFLTPSLVAGMLRSRNTLNDYGFGQNEIEFRRTLSILVGRHKLVCRLQIIDHVISLVFSVLLSFSALAAPTCVVKLAFSSSNMNVDQFYSQGATDAVVGQGYKVIGDGILNHWSAYDYEVQVNMSHEMEPNYGFPHDLVSTTLYIADSSGQMLVNESLDSSRLQGDIRNSLPLCNSPRQSQAVETLPPLNDGAAAIQ